MSFEKAMLEAKKQLEFEAKKVYYRSHPEEWVQDRLGGFLWSKQAEVAQSVVDFKRTAVKSSNGVGKSYLGALLACWWLDVHPVGKSLVISTAPTFVQITRILWRYIRRFHAENDLYGSITQDNVWKAEDSQQTLMGFGRKPQDDDISGFQGYHEDFILVLVDEAGGISETLYTGFEAVTTNDNARILAIGNPDNRGTEFHRTFDAPDHIWNKITISFFDTPNFTGEKVPESIKTGLTSATWAQERLEEWGEDSPRYQAKVLGEFPNQSENTLFSQLTLAKAIDTEIFPSTETTPVLGCDIARYGSDFSTAYMYHDGVLRFIEKWQKADTIESANTINRIAIEQGCREVRVDGVGIGAGVYDQLKRLAQGNYEVIGMIGNGLTPDPAKWYNVRAYWFDTLREKMHKGLIDMDFDDKKLKEELEGIQYKFSKSQASMLIESKDEMKKRGVKSPDYADAAAYACADLNFDPTDPASKLALGEVLNVGLEEALMGMMAEISPY